VALNGLKLAHPSKDMLEKRKGPNLLPSFREVPGGPFSHRRGACDSSCALTKIQYIMEKGFVKRICPGGDSNSDLRRSQRAIYSLNYRGIS